MKLQNKTAIVTGGAQGMGRAIVLRYVAEGANLVIADLNLAGAQTLASEIEQLGGQALAVAVDVRDQGQGRYFATFRDAAGPNHVWLHDVHRMMGD